MLIFYITNSRNNFLRETTIIIAVLFLYRFRKLEDFQKATLIMIGIVILQIIAVSSIIAIFFEDYNSEAEAFMTVLFISCFIVTGIIGGLFSKGDWLKTCKLFAIVLYILCIVIVTLSILGGSELLSYERSGFSGLPIIFIIAVIYGIALTIVFMILITPTTFLGSFLYKYIYKKYFVKDVVEIK